MPTPLPVNCAGLKEEGVVSVEITERSRYSAKATKTELFAMRGQRLTVVKVTQKYMG
jgi:hypothetical protein